MSLVLSHQITTLPYVLLLGAICATWHLNAQSIVALRTSGPAPLGLHLTVQDTVSWATIEQTDYEWEYPDQSIDVGYQSVNTLTQSGWVRLRSTALDQSVELDSIYITVIDPDIYFPGEMTICLSSTGSFNGCPAGAEKITMEQLNGLPFEPKHRYLFRHGDSYSLSTSKSIGHGALLSSFGDTSLPKPVITLFGSPTSDYFFLGDSSSIEHLHFQGSEWVLGSGWSGPEYGEGRLFSPQSKNTLFDLIANQMTTFCVSDDGSGLKQNLVIDSVKLEKLGAYFLYAGPSPSLERIGVRRVVINDIVSQHGIRMNGGRYLCVQDFSSHNVDRSHITLRTCQHALIRDSRFTGKGLYKCSIRNVSDDSSLEDTVRFVLYERNIFTGEANEFGIDMAIGSDVILRNNLFLNASLNINTNQAGFPIQRVKSVHNTFYLDNYGWASALHIKPGITGSFDHNIVLIENCTTPGCVQENPYHSSSSQNPVDWSANGNCYFVDGDPTGNNFIGSTTFTSWQNAGLDLTGKYGPLPFASISSDVHAADFTPLPSSLPTTLTSHITHRDISRAKRSATLKNTAGAVETVFLSHAVAPPPVRSTLFVYPNPATGAVTLKTISADIGSVYTIYNLQGCRIRSGIISDEETIISTDQLPTGSYIIYVGAGHQKVGRMVKQ